MMNISKSYFVAKFSENNVKASITLKEHMLTKIAIQFCHNFELKKYILCMSESMDRYNMYCDFHNESFMNEWEETIEKQSAIMYKNLLPRELEPILIARIRRVALQMLSWSKQWQRILEVPRDFVDHLLVPADWTTEARLNEIQIAERLVQDDRIDVHNRYKIACLHCLEPFIFSLHQKIDLISIYFKETPCKRLVSKICSLWYFYLREEDEVNVHRQFWNSIFGKAIKAGERTAVLYCWKKLSEHDKQNIIITAARIVVKSCYIRQVLHKAYPKMFFDTLPVFPIGNYGDILYFLLSQMNEEQKIAFFETELRHECILACMLVWPYEELFVSIIIKLWNILPKNIYGTILLKLAHKYIDRKENQECNYGHLLKELLKQTPESYKRYIFSIQCNDQGEAYSEGAELIHMLIKKQPFEYGDVEILQFILQLSTPEEKQSIMHSKLGIQLCESVILGGNLTLINWILIQCMPENLVVNFKKKFLLSEKGYYACFCLLKDGKTDQINVFLEWGFSSAEEISEFKSVLFFKKEFQSQYKNLIQIFQVDEMERILEWCLPSKNNQKQYKIHLFQKCGKEFCINFLRECKWEEVVLFIRWCLASEESIGSLGSEESTELEEEIFPEVAKFLFNHLVIKFRLEDAILLNSFFRLCAEQIIKMIFEEDGSKRIRLILRCCSDEDTVLPFKAEISQVCGMTHVHEAFLDAERMQNLGMFEQFPNLTSKRKCNIELNQGHESEEGGSSQVVKRLRKEKF